MLTEAGVEIKTKQHFEKDPEKFAASLRGHIVNAHFSPGILAWMGVARYDIELSRDKGIPLDWVTRKAYERLEEEDEVIRQRLSKGIFVYVAEADPVYKRLGGIWDASAYRHMIIRNLIYIEQLGLAQIDWERVTRSVPDANDIVLDIERDSHDPFVPSDGQPIILQAKLNNFKNFDQKEIIKQPIFSNEELVNKYY